MPAHMAEQTVQLPSSGLSRPDFPPQHDEYRQTGLPLIEGIFEPEADERLSEHKSRLELKDKIEKHGRILPNDHFFVSFLTETLVPFKADFPAKMEIWVVDGDGREMYYSPSANVVVAGRGFFKFCIEQSRKRDQEATQTTDLLLNPFAELLKKQQTLLSIDHVVMVIHHEVKHALQTEEKKGDKLDIDWTIDRFIANRHEKEYDADIYAMKTAALRYNPWAMVDLLWMLQPNHGKQSWSHPDILDRIRLLESFLTDDSTPLPNTAQLPTSLPDKVLTWLSVDLTDPDNSNSIYHEVHKLTQLNSAELSNKIMLAHDPVELLHRRMWWEHHVLLEQATRLAKTDELKRITLLAIVLKSFTWSSFYGYIKAKRPLSEADEKAEMDVHDLLSKTVNRLDFKPNRDPDLEFIHFKSVILVPEVEDAWMDFLNQSFLPPIEPYESTSQAVLTQLESDVEELIAAMQTFVNDPKTDVEIRKVLEEKLSLVTRVKAGELTESLIGEVLFQAFAAFDQKSTDDQASQQSANQSNRTYRRDRNKNRQSTEATYFNFSEPIDQKRALTLVSVALALQLVDIPEMVEHSEKLSQLLIDLSGLTEADADFISKIALGTDKKTFDTSYRYIKDINDVGRIWAIHQAGTQHFPTTIPNLMPKNSQWSMAYQASQKMVFRYQPTNYSRGLFDTESNPYHRGILFNSFGFQEVSNATIYFLHDLLRYTNQESPYHLDQKNPFDSHSPLTLEQWLYLSQDQYHSLRENFDYFAIKEFLHAVEPGQLVSELVLDVLKQMEELPTSIDPEEIVRLFVSAPFSPEQKSTLIHSCSSKLNQQWALTGDQTSKQLLYEGWRFATPDQRETLTRHILGAAFWYELERKQIRFPTFYISSFQEDELEPILRNVQQAYVDDADRKPLIIQTIKKVLTDLYEAGIVFSLENFEVNPYLPTTYANLSNVGGVMGVYDTFSPNFLRLMSFLSAKELQELAEYCIKTNVNSEPKEHFSFGEELLVFSQIPDGQINSIDKLKKIELFAQRNDDNSYRATFEFFEVLDWIYQKHGKESIQWVLDNFQPSAERDALLAGLGLEDQDLGKQVTSLDKKTFFGPIDSGLYVSDNDHFPFETYVDCRENPRQPDWKSYFQGKGLIGRDFHNLLTRRRDFGLDAALYYHPYQKRNQVIEPGSYRQQLVGKHFLQHEMLFTNPDAEFSTKVASLCQFWPDKCLIRDQYLEILIRDQLAVAETPQAEIEYITMVVELFSPTHAFRQRIGARLFLLEEEQGAEWAHDYVQGMEKINHYFPSASLVRKYFLEKLSLEVSLTYHQSTELREAINSSGENNDKLLGQSILVFNLMAELERSEKFSICEWLLDLSNDKPSSIEDIEDRYDGHLDDLPRYFQSLLPLEQESILKRLLLGEEGIFDIDVLQGDEYGAAALEKRLFAERAAEKLIPDDADGSVFLRQAFTLGLEKLPPSHAAQLFSHLLSKNYIAASMGKNLSLPELAAVFLSELSTPGIKSTQVLSDLKAVPATYRSTFQTTQEFAGKQLPITSIFSFFEAENLLDSHQHGLEVISVDTLLGDASNKQGALITIKVTQPALLQKLGATNSELIIQAVARVKRPSSQKTTNIDTYFDFGQQLLEIAHQHFGKNAPPKLVETIKNATFRELDFKAEAIFTHLFTEFTERLGTVGEIKINVPTILFVSDDLIIETIAPGQSVREFVKKAQNASEVEAVKVSAIVTVLLSMLQDGLVHADPTFANIFYDSETKTMSFLDRGMHVFLNEADRAACVDLVIALQTKNKRSLQKACQKLGWRVPAQTQLKLDGSLFQNAENLIQAIMYSTQEVPDNLSSVAYVIFRLQPYFEGLSQKSADQIGETLKQNLEIDVWKIFLSAVGK